jgi:hypothetical protein
MQTDPTNPTMVPLSLRSTRGIGIVEGWAIARQYDELVRITPEGASFRLGGLNLSRTTTL